MSRFRRIAALFVVALGTLFAPGVVALANAADFDPGAGTYTANTTALTLTGPHTNITGTNQGGVAVFSFGNVNIPATVTINVSGSRPFRLQASASLTLAGVINGRGASASDFVAGPNAGGPGGGFGGADASQRGGGSGGGGVASMGNNGGGGGGFGGMGADGGLCTDPTPCPGAPTGTAGAGGTAYGALNVLFQGGSGGGGASTVESVGGGGGGGALALFASSLKVTSTGQVLADGGNGAVGGFGASGGGSGGGILIHGDVVQVDGLLSAGGGQGGAGGCCGDGGGGGGGQIAYQFATLVATGTTNVSGGTSGTAGGLGHGGPSPEPTGFDGVVTQLQGAIVATQPATSVSPTGATLNGTVDPNSGTTSYHFEYGTTSAYGSQMPATDVLVGSDTTSHAESQTISGLSPNTTYHYRIVATDDVGLVSRSPDATFTTPLAPPAVASMRASTTGATAKLTFKCQGMSGQTCSGGFNVTAHEHKSGGTVQAIAAGKHKHKKTKTKVVTVSLGSGAYSVSAGGSATVSFTLKSTGKRLLSQFYKLPTTFTFSATSGTAIGARTIKFSYTKITSNIGYNFSVFTTAHPPYTTFTRMTISGVPSGGSVTASCRGGGCPFGRVTKKHKQTVSLTSLLSKAHLSPGATLRISITAPNRVGKVESFSTHANAAPSVAKRCLPPGAGKPLACV